MKKIAVTIDEETLGLIDELLGSSRLFRSRSALVRAVIRALPLRSGKSARGSG